jgi:GTP:adenosylcobinamide-phosphate guanylyltransferase
MDEADAFYCNAPGSCIKIELAVQELLARIRPMLRMSVSATLIPVFLHLKEKQHGVDVNSIIYTCPGEDHNGVQDFRALVNASGDNVFLHPGDLTKTNSDFNDKVAALYHTALATQNSLVLNITNPGVSTFSNVHDHAIQIQQAYDHVGCIVFVGKGFYY